MLLALQAGVVAVFRLSTLNFVWMTPLAVVLGSLSRFFPLSLLSTAGEIYARICCFRLAKVIVEEERKDQYAPVAKRSRSPDAREKEIEATIAGLRARIIAACRGNDFIMMGLKMFLEPGVKPAIFHAPIELVRAQLAQAIAIIEIVTANLGTTERAARTYSQERLTAEFEATEAGIARLIGAKQKAKEGIAIFAREDADVQFLLGQKYAEGNEESKTEAAVWFRQAAEKGDARAQYQLGIMYSNGQGVSPDNVEAYMWLDLASQGKATDAEDGRVAVAARMTAAQIAEAQRLARDWKPAARDISIATVPFSASLPSIGEREPVQIYKIGKYSATIFRNPPSYAEVAGIGAGIIDYVYAMVIRSVIPPHLPLLIITAERSGAKLRDMIQDANGFQQSTEPFLCFFDSSGAHSNLGSFADLTDVDVFATRALSIARERLHIEEPVTRV